MEQYVTLLESKFIQNMNLYKHLYKHIRNVIIRLWIFIHTDIEMGSQPRFPLPAKYVLCIFVYYIHSVQCYCISNECISSWKSLSSQHKLLRTSTRDQTNELDDTSKKSWRFSNTRLNRYKCRYEISENCSLNETQLESYPVLLIRKLQSTTCQE